ncbi:sensor histidine kinase [Pseudogracilibacillus auburnensis]|uniref:sensor histidine kinase n=1 Tax=Pseudogracilibacillus auburnensis TaxID=1494959 RepID=UPI001A973057|nr:HAMP domain-containing sensor histidine kinase [Pseudogracilibacillus auburnensis]MBO1003887.1 HAMP domain-containing histidine kinase [Pseudogracilibacillus auburnensis]
MVYLLLTILCTILIIFFFHLLQTRRQIKQLSFQLQRYNREETSMKVNLSTANKSLEDLAIIINETIDKKTESEVISNQMQKELKRAVASMSHDLRTPLTSIIGYLQLINDKNISEEQREEYLHIVLKRTSRLHTLIDNFFSLSIVDSEEYLLQPKKTLLNTLLQEILLSYYDEFTTAGKEPTIHIVEENLFVLIDETAFKRIVENVLLNAIQHSNGNITIELKKEDHCVLFEVTNTIKPDDTPDIKHIFDRFYTTDRARNHGNGLGLSIVQRLMNKTNGQVKAEINKDEFNIVCTWHLYQQV